MGHRLQWITGHDCRGHASVSIADLTQSFTLERSADRPGQHYQPRINYQVHTLSLALVGHALAECPRMLHQPVAERAFLLA